MLLEDKMTCVPISVNISENTIDDGKSSCSKGYQKDILSDKCIDVDECDTSEATCTNNQVCINEIGSYKCIDILPPNSDCKTGFRFNVKTETCEGK